MSENYIVSARKYRPMTFDAVVGQEALTHTLKTAIKSGRLAHAYLFCGPRGVGKTTCARIFAKAINCQHLSADGEPCNECESCRAFNEQRSYNIVELDAASNNSVDDIRTITEQVHIPPQVGRYRVFIIDEVHMLSTQAFNAFLKTLEEPPEYCIFILATTEKQKIIPTILSRCQIYDFNRITVPDIVRQLQFVAKDRGIEAETAALNVIAQKADGAMRDALSIFDQVSASSEGHITYQSAIDNLNVLDYDYYFRLDECFLTGNVQQALLIYKEVRDHGFDSQFFINGVAQHLRDLMVASNPQTAKLLEMNDDTAQRFVQESARFAPGFYYRAMDLCNTCDLNYRNASNKQFIVELTLIKLCQLLKPTPLPPGGGDQPQPLKPITAGAPTASTAAPATQPATAAPAQQAAAPQAAPQAAAQPQPAAPARPAMRQQPARPAAPRIMIHNMQPAGSQQPGEAATAAPAAAHTARTQPYTAQQLLAAWQGYIAAYPHKVLVVNAMRACQPVQVNGDNWQVTVRNSGEQNYMQEDLSVILPYLRNALKNDMIAINVQVGKSGPKTYIPTDKELVEDLAQRNPQFKTIITDWGLSLA